MGRLSIYATIPNGFHFCSSCYVEKEVSVRLWVAAALSLKLALHRKRCHVTSVDGTRANHMTTELRPETPPNLLCYATVSSLCSSGWRQTAIIARRFTALAWLCVVCGG